MLLSTDRIFGKMLDPLAEKCGGAVNFAIILMISVITTFCVLMIFLDNYYGIVAGIMIFVVMVLSAKIFTRDKIRIRNPWWYK